MGIILKDTITSGLSGILYLLGDTVTINNIDIPAIVSVFNNSEEQEIDGILLEGDIQATFIQSDLAPLESDLNPKDLITYQGVKYRITNVYKDPLGATLRISCNRYE